MQSFYRSPDDRNGMYVPSHQGPSLSTLIYLSEKLSSSSSNQRNSSEKGFYSASAPKKTFNRMFTITIRRTTSLDSSGGNDGSPDVAMQLDYSMSLPVVGLAVNGTLYDEIY